MPSSTDSSLSIVPPSDETIAGHIYMVRGRRVMLDVDLATLYDVPTKRLNEQVSRNLSRFPEDFLFRLTDAETAQIRSQFATGSSARRNTRFRPYAFTEHGVTMLSAVLRSDRAVTVSVAVVRAFVRLREILATHVELAHRIDELEQRSTYHDGQLTLLVDVVHELLAGTREDVLDKSRPQIGFRVEPR